jgi:hypothetical protein
LRLERLRRWRLWFEPNDVVVENHRCHPSNEHAHAKRGHGT